ncbi:Putative phage gene [Moritella viscosa]|uniref:replication endonuclease n=1 Tax=Moritella viscosa TaxID=80854 RepID=UPI000917FD68|nr:replication endonuclease [Moritella viscosa]SGZ09053.1 Putative phage gene [Moritella viscosa]
MVNVNHAQSLSGRSTIIEMIESAEDCSSKPVRMPALGKEFPQPEMSLIENAMFQVNPDLEDHQWRKQFFGDMPHYLSRYFAERYIKAFKRNGRQYANKYLRKTVGAKINPRLKKVLAQYNQQAKYRNSYIRSDDLFREKLLAEMDKSELKVLAQQYADFFTVQLDNQAAEQDEAQDYEQSIIQVFCGLREISRKFGYTPPYDKPESDLTAAEAECGILRLTCNRAWESKLKAKRSIMREHLAIAVGQVQKSASPYCSRDCLHEWKNQKQRNRDFIKGMSVFDEDMDEEIALSEMFYKSTGNPAIRRCELMVRMRGYENIAQAMGCEGLFLTLTAPSKYHHTRKKGGFIDHWMGNSPRDAQRYLCSVWAKIRAQFKRDDISVFGIRVVEPHHDGTPHWHLLLFMQPHDVKRASEVFTHYAVQEDFKELFPSINKKEIAVGPPNLRTRCEIVAIDSELGSATGYIAKYISKNIDGYAMDDEKDDETGRDQKEMAAHVTAWASRWRIRQFQAIGGAPVTTYRELRRYANNDVNTFKSYVALLNAKQQYNLFTELFPDQNPYLMGPKLDFQGPRLNYAAMNSLQRWDVLTSKYKVELKTDIDSASTAMKCADKGDFAGYVMAQGGPFVKRKNLLIRNDYDVTEMGNEYGEYVGKIQGFKVTNETPVKTRLRNWVIQRKSQALLDSEASTSSTEGAEGLMSPEGASRSSVTNCTPSKSDRLNTGIKTLLKSRGINLDDHLVNAMEQGGQIRLDKDQIMKFRRGYYADSKYHPPELVEMRPKERNIWEGWNTPALKVDNNQEFVPGWEDWENWDWG